MFHDAVGLAEELVAVTDAGFSLSSVDGLADTIRRLADDELVLFVRVLTHTLCELPEARRAPRALATSPRATRQRWGATGHARLGTRACAG